MITVLFRVERDGGTLAVFPYIPQSLACLCYSHAGQHVTADWLYLRDNTRPATPSEAGALLDELKAVGYRDLRMIRKLPGWRAIRDARASRPE